KPVETRRPDSLQSLHAVPEVRPRRLHSYMDMVAHDDERMKPPRGNCRTPPTDTCGKTPPRPCRRTHPDGIRNRPATHAAQLFVGQTALRGRPLSSCAIAAALDRAYRRCGFLGWFGTHRLRHTFATRLHAHGA